MESCGCGLTDAAASIEAVFASAGVNPLPEDAYQQFAAYSELLLRWNSRFNLTSLREPSEIWRRHFAECAFAAQHLPVDVVSLLDYGSGAGFPGIPFQICRPGLRVTLAEAQSKKAVFLREVTRSLGLTAEVVTSRVEGLPPDLTFDAVCLRAVENMEAAIANAVHRARRWLVLFTTHQMLSRERSSVAACAGEWSWAPEIGLPNSDNRILCLISQE